MVRIVFEAAFDVYSGYGSDAVNMALALDRAGAEVTLAPRAITSGLPREFTDLLTRDPHGPKDLLLRFGDPGQMNAPFTTPLPRVAYTMWERSLLLEGDFREPFWRPAGPDDQHRDDLDVEKWRVPLTGKDRFAGWDHVVVTCPMNVDALDPVTPEGTSFSVVPNGIDPDLWVFRRREFTTDRPVRFLMVGMLGGRKAPFVALDAWKRFRETHPEIPATLHLHSLARGGVHPLVGTGSYYPDVTTSHQPLTQKQLLAMYHDHDVMLSVSRGEGNNKPAMEFMSTGGLVMATDWAGHQNWLWPDCTIPLAGDLRPAAANPAALEFYVDEDALVDRLAEVAGDPQRIREYGERASRTITSALSWDAVTSTLLGHLRRIL